MADGLRRLMRERAWLKLQKYVQGGPPGWTEAHWFGFFNGSVLDTHLLLKLYDITEDHHQFDVLYDGKKKAMQKYCNAAVYMCAVVQSTRQLPVPTQPDADTLEC